MSGVLPVIFASTILSLPTSIRDFAGITADSGWIYSLLSAFGTNRITYAVLYFLLIMAFNYFYVTIQYNPIEIATISARTRHRARHPAGTATASFAARCLPHHCDGRRVPLDHRRCAHLVSVISGGRLNISLGGTSLIIVMSVALIPSSPSSMMMMRHYKGFLE